MKKLILITLGLLFSIVIAQAQSTEMYIMKAGNIIGYYDITDVDSILFHEPVFVAGQPFTDLRDFNVYQTVQIGNQVWMAENLKYLPEVNPANFSSGNSEVYYVYGYNGENVDAAKETANYNTYGVLYNWTAAAAGSDGGNSNPSGIQGVCPNGWHLPSIAEWYNLELTVGTSSGTVLSEAGNAHWISGGTNAFGFTALPGGGRMLTGSFAGITEWGAWWTSNIPTGGEGKNITINYQTAGIYDELESRSVGYSVRCVRN